MGRIVRAHGLRGQVVVVLTTNRPERLEVGAVLSVAGRAVQVRSSSVAPAGAGHDRWLVDLEGVTTRADADALRGEVLSAEAIDDPAVLWVHDLVGAEVRDAAGVRRGVVTDVLANPASDLLQLDSGALVPLRFVVGPVARPPEGAGPTAPTVVTVDVPEGLWDLHDEAER